MKPWLVFEAMKRSLSILLQPATPFILLIDPSVTTFAGLGKLEFLGVVNLQFLSRLIRVTTSWWTLHWEA